MVSKDAGKCPLTNSESDSEATAASMALEVKGSLDESRQVRKRNKALQVRFKDICEAQNEQAAAARGGKPVYKVAYRKYMTVPARRSIPNVTKSTGVQTSPDLRKRYQTFPFERKKGHTVKHAAVVESCKDQDDGFVIDVKRAKATEAGRECVPTQNVRKTKALMHTSKCVATIEQHPQARDYLKRTDGPCSDALVLPCPTDGSTAGTENSDYQICSVRSKHSKGFQGDSETLDRSGKLHLLNSGESGGNILEDSSSKVTGPIAWNSLTQVECLESPSERTKRKKTLQLNGLQSQTLPRTRCTTQVQCHVGTLSARPLGAVDAAVPLTPASSTAVPMPAPPCRGGTGSGTLQTDNEVCKQIVPVNQDGEVKAQLQAMENMISSSQETIKVLLGVIQELEKGEAHREGLSYRTGQDTANCDTCRNSACIIYSVELDFKLQEDKLQPLMKRLCPTEESPFPPLTYPQETIGSTPKRKSKAEAKKHARWKLWFL
ncbi:protein FAM196A-like isoform X1 [Carassius auratus]|uniref:Protein FAM196A-like isoform X1 n=1 Tax=Carassius auratus TaxID=7957 RepID=A0A6P6L0E5_CARAU|nr:protein FAM196A-like isoform X1 [Carassius auratus]XP_026077995.1 protein FAM196A-like isoform X1 [Carassius auratus]